MAAYDNPSGAFKAVEFEAEAEPLVLPDVEIDWCLIRSNGIVGGPDLVEGEEEGQYDNGFSINTGEVWLRLDIGNLNQLAVAEGDIEILYAPSGA